jgi:hypothetical protein
VVLLDDIVEILVGPDLHIAPAGVLTSQQPQRASTRHVAVERYLARHTRKGRGKRFAKECLCGRDAAVATQKEVDGLAMLVDGAVQVLPLGFDREWSERPDVVELSSGLSAPNRTCTFPRIRLSVSSVAHSKNKIGVTRFEGISLLFSQDIRIAFRQPPPELTLAAGHQAPQCDAARYSPTITTAKDPRRGTSGLRSANPMTAKGFEGGAILPRKPVPELPEDDSIQPLEHHGRVIGEPVEVRPSRQDAVQTFHHVNFVNAVIALTAR